MIEYLLSFLLGGALMTIIVYLFALKKITAMNDVLMDKLTVIKLLREELTKKKPTKKTFRRKSSRNVKRQSAKKK